MVTPPPAQHLTEGRRRDITEGARHRLPNLRHRKNSLQFKEQLDHK